MSALRLGAPARHAELIHVPGDKSISHRAVMLAASARGLSRVFGINRGADVAATLSAMRALGALIADDGREIRITGRPFVRDAHKIDCGNSGTTMRLCMGLVAGRTSCEFDGDASLRRRPMERVAAPLRLMGADITTADGRPPLRFRRSAAPLRAIDYHMPIASAQVKSALLFAGLRAEGVTTVLSPHPSRDHTERMLAAMGAQIESTDNAVSIWPGELSAVERLDVPGDFSAAAFFIVAIAAAPGAVVHIENVGVNPTRTAALDVMREMGVDVTASEAVVRANEPSATLSVRGGAVAQPALIEAAVVPNLLDEIPALCALAALGGVRLEVSGAAELRVKESDRISALAHLLRSFGAHVDESADGLVVHEGRLLRVPPRVDTHGDHRLGLTAASLAAALGSPIEIEDADCIATSFPDFAAAWSAAFGITVG